MNWYIYPANSKSASWLWLLLCLALCLGQGLTLCAKVTSSVASGNWSNPATWNNGVPADGDTIVINAPHTVALTSDINFTAVGSSLTIHGTLNLGTFICWVRTNVVSATGQVIQNTTAGGPQQANLRGLTVTLHASSVYSYTGNLSGFLGTHPIYGNLHYSSTSTSAGVFEVGLTVNGNLVINNTGSGEISFGNTFNRTHNINGSLQITAGNVVGSNGSANVLLAVNGNFIISTGASFKGCNGTGNTFVNLAGNYTQNGTLTSPGSGTFRITFIGNTTSTVNGAALIQLPNVTTNKSGGAHVVLNQSITVGQNLTFTSGRVQIGNFNLTIGAGATITNASASSGFVETNGTGKLIFAQATPGATFPVGHTNYTPASIATNGVSVSYGLRVVNGFLADTGCTGFVTDDAVKKMWLFSRESGSGLIQNMNLTWNGADEGITFTRNVCGIVQYVGGDWETPIPNAATGSDPYTRGRLFSGVVDGTFGVVDTSAALNISAPTGTSNSPVCVGATINLTRTSPNVPGATYQWSKVGGGFTPPAGPNASIPNAQPTDAGNYLLTISKYGCVRTSTAVPVNVIAGPTCSITGPTTVCANSTGNSYSGPAGMTSYSWSVTGNANIVGPNNQPSVSVSASAAGTFILSLTVVGTNGCPTTCDYAVTVQARPTGVLSGNTTICPGGSAVLLISTSGTPSWSGTLSDGTPFGGSTSPIAVSVSPTSTTTYTIGALQDAHCAAEAAGLSGSATVTVATPTAYSVTGGGAYCAGGSGMPVGLSGSELGVQYQLLHNGNPIGAPLSGTGTSISFGNQTLAGTYTVVATLPPLNCTATMNGSAVITILPPPAVSLSLSPNSANALDPPVALAGGSPAGGTYSGPGVSGGQLYPAIAGVGAHTIAYTVTDSNGCTNSATDVFTISAAPGLNLFISGPDSVNCNDTFEVSIYAAANFTHIGTLQFSVDWDGDAFAYINALTPSIGVSAPMTGLVDSNFVYSWLDTEGGMSYGETLPDGSLLATLYFIAGTCGSSDSVSIASAPRAIEATDNNLAEVSVVLLGAVNVRVVDTIPPTFVGLPGDVTVNCNSVPGPASPTATDNCDPEPDIAYLGETRTDGSCPHKYLLVRTWRASDGCGNSTVVSQTIVVQDVTPPSFTPPANTTVYLDSLCQYAASPAQTGTVTMAADNCSPDTALVATYTDNFVPSSGGQGTLQRSWVVTDLCGNTAPAQVQLIVVVDTMPPRIACPPNATVSGSGGEECAYAPSGGSADPLAFDNCGIGTRTYSLSGATTGSGSGTLNGVTLNIGSTTISWMVSDVNGNFANCSFTLTVVECSGISGKLIWKGDPTNNAGVAQAMVFLTGDATDTYGPTDPTGLYTVSGGGNVTITPSKLSPPADFMNGVTAADVLILQYHLAGSAPITDPYVLLAADVDNNNTVNSTDWFILRRAVLGDTIYRAYLKIRPWRFVPTPDPGPGFPGYTPPANPFSMPIPNSRPLVGVSGGVTQQNFFGLKMGDLNFSANPNLRPAPSKPLVWRTEDVPLQAGQAVTVVFRAHGFQQLVGYQYAVRFDPDILDFSGVDLYENPLHLSASDDFGWDDLSAGIIRTLWTGSTEYSLLEDAPVFALRFVARQSGLRLSDALALDANEMRPEAYRPEGILSDVLLVFTETTSHSSAPEDAPVVRLLPNRPNPFSGETTLGFVLPQPCEVQLRLLNAAGQEVLRWNNFYPSGYSEEVLHLDNAPGGVLFAELITPFGKAVRRLLLVRP